MKIASRSWSLGFGERLKANGKVLECNKFSLFLFHHLSFPVMFCCASLTFSYGSNSFKVSLSRRFHSAIPHPNSTPTAPLRHLTQPRKPTLHGPSCTATKLLSYKGELHSILQTACTETDALHAASRSNRQEPGEHRRTPRGQSWTQTDE
jgi:hypothetical protein